MGVKNLFTESARKRVLPKSAKLVCPQTWGRGTPLILKPKIDLKMAPKRCFQVKSSVCGEKIFNLRPQTGEGVPPKSANFLGSKKFRKGRGGLLRKDSVKRFCHPPLYIHYRPCTAANTCGQYLPISTEFALTS